jgi:hypothetical protein
MLEGNFEHLEIATDTIVSQVQGVTLNHPIFAREECQLV